MPLTPYFSQMLTWTGPSRNLSAGLLPEVAALSFDSEWLADYVMASRVGQDLAGKQYRDAL